jgi:hypothetical protein
MTLRYGFPSLIRNRHSALALSVTNGRPLSVASPSPSPSMTVEELLAAGLLPSPIARATDGLFRAPG